MSIKSQGGVFGRNPTFNDITVDGDLSIAGTLSVGGETITGLSYQGGWNADTNTPDIAASSPATGQFWIVSTDGSTDVGGITNWTSGDWALYDGTNWQRVEGGNTDLSTGVQGQLAVSNGGTGAADAATARTNLGLGTAATTAATDYATAAQGSTADSALQPADIGSTVQGYDADTAKYDDATANFTGTLQNGGSNVVVDSDIGSTVQGYDADTAKYDDATAAFTGNLSVDTNTLYVDSTNDRVGIGTASPNTELFVSGRTAVNNGTATITLENPTTASSSGLSMGKVEWKTKDASAPGISGFIDVQDYNNFGTAFKMLLGGGLVGSGVTGLELDALGNATIPVGNLVIGTSGKGIDFSATSGTGTSELLDDYEEGEVSLSTIYADVDITGNYIKCGRMVTVMIAINPSTPDITFAAGNTITGLPYAAAVTSSAAGGNYNGGQYYGGYMMTGTTMRGRFYVSGTSLTIIDGFGTSTNYSASFTYISET